MECPGRDLPVRAAVGRDDTVMAARSVGCSRAAVVVGLREPAVIPIRRAVGPCQCSRDEADFLLVARQAVITWTHHRPAVLHSAAQSDRADVRGAGFYSFVP